MTWRPTEPGNDTFIPTGARYIRENWECIQNVLGANVLSENKKIEIFPPGTNLWFYQDVAPLGWSTITAIGDSLLAIKGDGASAYTTGGTEQGTWQQVDHALTIDEMPSHAHDYLTWPHYPAQPNTRQYQIKDFDYYRSYLPEPTSHTGGNQPHNHGDTWRPQASVGIICTKDPM